MNSPSSPRTRQEKQAQKRAVALAYKPQDGPTTRRASSPKERAASPKPSCNKPRHTTFPSCAIPTLSDLLAGVETGGEIPTEAFLAVAEILRYVYTLKGEEPPQPLKQR